MSHTGQNILRSLLVKNDSSTGMEHRQHHHDAVSVQFASGDLNSSEQPLRQENATETKQIHLTVTDTNNLIKTPQGEVGQNYPQKQHDDVLSESQSAGIPIGMGRAARASIGTSSSLGGRHPHAREISETLASKLFEMRNCWISLLVNCLLVIFIRQLNLGLTVPLSPAMNTTIGCVILELVLLLSNIVTSRALDDGAAAFFGHKLADRRGYSLAICGFLQSNVFKKVKFGGQLSLNSSIRKITVRSALLWFLLHVILWLTPLSATALHGDIIRQDIGSVECVEFSETGLPVDRQWPVATVETGLAEVVFGSAIGFMRSENSNLAISTAVLAPQIMGSINDGDTIVGDGYTVDVLTRCQCAPTSDAAGLAAVNVPSSVISALLSSYMTTVSGNSLTSAIIIGGTQSPVQIYSLIGGTNICGGRNNTNPTVPVCSTTFDNHRSAQILVGYMMDGTPASIAPSYLRIRNYEATVSAANTSIWIGSALTAIMEGTPNTLKLPSVIPGAINPLLWWTASNYQAIDPLLIEPGIETLFSILLRAGVQRTFASRGMSCVRNAVIAGSSILTLADYGAVVALSILAFQLFATLVGIVGFFPWLMCEHPIGPAVRMTREPVFFTIMANCSSMLQDTHELCNAQTHAIWQALDMVVRVGEPLSSRDDPQFGHIIMDRPKLVAWLTNGKRYF